uniref:Packaging protein UL32 n=1 Tax=Human herpesvirus 3 TaxID=10335 RepID=A0A4D6F6B8_HHV3|nr:ORF26 [Human alphaherpesvirus 3]
MDRVESEEPMDGFESPVFSENTSSNSGWCSDAFSDSYIAYNPALLLKNDLLFSELLFASHLINVPRAIENNVTYEASSAVGVDNEMTSSTTEFIEEIGDVLALDRACLVCRTLDLYKRKFGLTPEWVADYAMLCMKSLASPPCAVVTFSAAFEFVYLMDRYYLCRYNVTLVGSFARRTLSLLDIQRHFFLHVCFRTDGGLPGIRPPPGKEMANKVRYSNYSFFVQAVVRAALLSISTSRLDETETRKSFYFNQDGLTGGPQPLAAALANWKDCARMVDCSSSEHRTSGMITCAERALKEDIEFEDILIDKLKKASYVDAAWGYADLALLLLSGVATWNVDERTNCAIETRVGCVKSYWQANRIENSRDVPKQFSKFTSEDACPEVAFGPILLTTLKNAKCRGRTNTECMLCCLLTIGHYWIALRQFKRDILAYSANNTSLFDCIEPVINAWSLDNPIKLKFPFNDEGRFITIVKAAGSEAVYKHLFCDLLCALSELQTNPKILFAHPTTADKEVLELYKAQLAAQNRFEGRVCAGLWTLAYAFKAYQIFPRKPTANAAFIRDGGLMLRRHAISLVSLEHTLSKYV